MLNMLRKLLLILIGIGSVGGATLSLLTLPLLRRLPKQSHVPMNEIMTLDDAVEACERTHLHGWILVEYAQSLVARKFTYSRLNIWDTPARAFERGMGYCEQQTLALKYIYDELGIKAKPVFALRCKFPPTVIDGMPWPGGVSGHAWLRVEIGGKEVDVCPGATTNTPGVTQFEILSTVYTWYPWLRPFTHLGSSIENVRRDMIARHSLKGTAKSPIDSVQQRTASAQSA
jgi:hypothetical protein